MAGEQIKFEVKATMTVTADTTVTIDAKTVSLHQVGVRGGSGTRIEIPLAKWDAIHDAVCRVRGGADAAAGGAAMTGYNCRSCNAALNPNDDAWQDTVNLTPDLLMIGNSVLFEFDEWQETVGADWCSAECFVRWLIRHVNEIEQQQGALR